MKIALVHDYLVQNGGAEKVLEAFCEPFPDAPIYCFAHKKGSILGHIEQRRIKSTYLSTFVTNETEFYQHAHKLPALAKNLFISCEYDLIINVSKGFSQGLKRCDSGKLISYIYDLDFEAKIKKGLVQKLFFPYVKSWIEKSLKEVDTLYVSREDLALRCRPLNPTTEVMAPPFRVSDYALFPKGMFKNNYYAIETQGLGVNQARDLAEWFKEWSIPFQFIGVDEHLNDLKSSLSSNTFFGNKCCGEHVPVLAAAKALISFNSENFPQYSLGTLATGRPVILASDLKKWVSGTGVFFIERFTKEEVKKVIDSLEAQESQLEGQKLRAHVMEYHDVKFKAQIKRILEKAQV